MTQHERSGLSAEDFLAIVDHELGNVTTVLVALTHTLDRRWEHLTSEERRDLSRRVASQADALVTLLTNLRLLRTGGGFAGAPGHTTLDPDPAQTLTRIGDDLRVATPSHELVVEVPPDLEPMPLDAGRLAQVLRNLVANAAKFAPAGTTIEVRAKSDGPWLQLTVDDAGPGIAPEDRERVFDKFVQLDPARPGTGLGLFISRAIVTGLGGELTIDESPAGGCRVCLRLPKSPAPLAWSSSP
jgi:two-component system sensor histidine kinase KdpD